MDIHDMSIKDIELILALKKEREKKEEAIPMLPPNEVSSLLYSNLLPQVEKIVESVLDNTYHEDNDNPQYIYENVMECFYGKDFWKWFNKNT